MCKFDIRRFMQEYFENLWLQHFPMQFFPKAIPHFAVAKNYMLFFTFPMIFEILLERSAGKLELQCNQAWYSLKGKVLFYFEEKRVQKVCNVRY